eukprot:1161419-Pelagomonas_calceolata.AAC.6
MLRWPATATATLRSCHSSTVACKLVGHVHHKRVCKGRSLENEVQHTAPTTWKLSVHAIWGSDSDKSKKPETQPSAKCKGE